jgi:5-methylcytosine-specific restriction endonuclease McrA
MTARSVPEWIGATPDTAIPPRVRLRVFEAHGGVCHISGRKIRAGEKWEADHVIALINGGENREANLAPALSDKHKAKTAADVRQKADVARKRQKHLGIKTESGRKLQSRGFDKTRRKKLNGTVEVRS